MIISKESNTNWVDVLFALSVTVTYTSLYVPTAKAAKMIVLSPTTAKPFAGVVIVLLELIVPASFVLNTNVGVVLILGVETCWIAVTVGLTWSAFSTNDPVVNVTKLFPLTLYSLPPLSVYATLTEILLASC